MSSDILEETQNQALILIELLSTLGEFNISFSRVLSLRGMFGDESWVENKEFAFHI
jgi:hypothetical protein